MSESIKIPTASANPGDAYYYLVRTRLGELTVYEGDFGPRDLATRLQRARAKGVLDFLDGSVFIDDLSSVKLYPRALLASVRAGAAQEGMEIDSWALLAVFIEWTQRHKVPLVLGDETVAFEDEPPEVEDEEDDEPVGAGSSGGGRRYRGKP